MMVKLIDTPFSLLKEHYYLNFSFLDANITHLDKIYMHLYTLLSLTAFLPHKAKCCSRVTVQKVKLVIPPVYYIPVQLF